LRSGVGGDLHVVDRGDRWILLDELLHDQGHLEQPRPGTEVARYHFVGSPAMRRKSKNVELIDDQKWAVAGLCTSWPLASVNAASPPRYEELSRGEMNCPGLCSKA
jgi:hypothetical protein